MPALGQQVSCAVDTTDEVSIILSPGEASFHNAYTLHGSEANASNRWRFAVGLNYAAASVSPLKGFDDTATLVRGDAGSTRFELEEAPASDLHPNAIKHHAWSRVLGQKRYIDVS